MIELRAKKQRYFVCDFETTVYEEQEHTEVWASASVELFTEDVKIFHSIKEQIDYFYSLNENIVCYFHNVKFDGNFLLYYFLVELGYKQAIECDMNGKPVRFMRDRAMPNNSVAYSISQMGQWYTITIKHNRHVIEFRDSLKLLPFTLKKIGESFGTKHKKLDMEYKGFRFAGCRISPKEREYIANDVLVIKEALEILFNQNHTKLTIGSCCLAEFKKSLGEPSVYDNLFPNLYEMKTYGEGDQLTVGDYIHQSYKGGWCYLVAGKERKIYSNGTTADVNSLYPSMMSSESGNRYPYGFPTFWSGNYIPDEATSNNRYYFVRLRTRFRIKKNKLPFIQIKNSLLYLSTKCLETSDIYSKKDNSYHTSYIDANGKIQQAYVTLTLTMTDYQLFKEHYDLIDCKILDGYYFETKIGIFDNYIEKYKTIKQNNKGAIRELAKLFLNNLYGKMASSTDSSFKVAYIKDDKTLGFYDVTGKDKQPGYIAVGSAITSYARNFTIRAAQANYYGVDNPGFIYADTDSIHCNLPAEKIRGIKVHPKNFCCWDLESTWDVGFFIRQKTYIEHVIAEELEPVEPWYNIKCAGMPSRSKALFEESLTGRSDILKEHTEEESAFIKKKRCVTDFTIGISVPGKLRPKRIKGGVVLVDTPYVMR